MPRLRCTSSPQRNCRPALSNAVELIAMEERVEEAAWVRQSVDGDRAAFEQLIRRYHGMIHALAWRMTGSTADADDLAQDIFIRAYRQLATYRGDAAFSSWLYRIGINTCLNWKKAAARRAQLQTAWTDQPAPSGVDGEVSARVQEALLKLPPKQRAAIILTVYEEMNHAEAARALGCSETTVSWRIHIARKKLRELLAAPELGTSNP